MLDEHAGIGDNKKSFKDKTVYGALRVRYTAKHYKKGDYTHGILSLFAARYGWNIVGF